MELNFVRSFSDKDLIWFTPPENAPHRKTIIISEYSNGCWLPVNVFCIDKYGYRYISRVIEGKKRRMTLLRYMYWQKTGFIDLEREYHIHHKCQNSWCCNPDHAEVISKHKHQKEHAIEKGHEYPDDFTKQIDLSLDFIFNKQRNEL